MSSTPSPPVDPAPASAPLDSSAGPASPWSEFGRSEIAKTGLRAVLTSGALLAVYLHVPLERRPHEEVALRLTVGLALFVAIVAFEARAIGNHKNPMLRATASLGLIIPFFLFLFAWIYLTMSISDPHAFHEVLNRFQALYFTVTVFSTVGFGDISPKNDAAQMVVTVQMLCDLAFLALVVRVVFGAATRGLQAKQGTTPPSAP